MDLRGPTCECCFGRGAFDRFEEMAMIRRENLEKLASLLILKAGQPLTWARAKIKLGTASLQWLPWQVANARTYPKRRSLTIWTEASSDPLWPAAHVHTNRRKAAIENSNVLTAARSSNWCYRP